MRSRTRRFPDSVSYRGFALSLEDGAQARLVSRRGGARNGRRRSDKAQRAVAADRSAVWSLSRGNRLSARDVRSPAHSDRAGAMSEADLIARIRELFPCTGDDAAV